MTCLTSTARILPANVDEFRLLSMENIIFDCSATKHRKQWCSSMGFPKPCTCHITINWCLTLHLQAHLFGTVEDSHITHTDNSQLLSQLLPQCALISLKKFRISRCDRFWKRLWEPFEYAPDYVVYSRWHYLMPLLLKSELVGAGIHVPKTVV